MITEERHRKIPSAETPKRLLLRVNEAAELVSCSRSTAYELIASGQWRVVRVGKSMRVVLADLERWVAENANYAA